MPALVLLTMLPFVWFGMIVAISFIETPLKFRAPGMTHALGVGIGRLVFKALNLVELAVAVVVIAAWTLHAPLVSPGAGALLITAMAALALQVAILRPAMAKRTRALSQTALTPDAGTPVRAKVGTGTHIAYITAETAKVITLPVAGILILLAVAA
ncbi:hypothetical protein [Specibacter sp. RAF43]|uniref:hypothetical protein n=1 Tax=Specibacter sp. RAF43 TaxID=3233057 RepID=UPI003F946A6E